jgi:hypothetical protein
MKQFTEFEAMVPGNFAALMVDYWESDETLSRDEVIAAYYDDSFKALDKRIAGTKCRFKPDLGYSDENRDGTLCFEIEDNNVVIPVAILEVI